MLCKSDEPYIINIIKIINMINTINMINMININTATYILLNE